MDMKSIKENLSKLKPNLNPEKSSYKTIEEILNNDFSYEEILKKIKTIKGVDKFPKNLKSIYDLLINNLTDLVIKERKQKQIEKQEENTRKLKEIVEALEKNIDTTIDKEQEIIKIEEELGLTPKKQIANPKKEEKEPEIINGKLAFKILFALVLLTLIIIVLLILFY